ncbi:Ig-like domain-containing protein [Clostridium sp. OS1-26]|uniref:Ig-like domain-containing protein n=1 Tax=Clostridium sp. OS1-26 TaxID=3070681 RepID=UPI0027E206FD|nr:Ig-like domain-containing protein [Clostridium sp. OS1-26]WML37819.1 Ig-like domain-containing protein [Clostridium sp. OS1-26]
MEFNNPVIPKGKKSIKFKIRTTTKPTNASDFMEVFDNCKTDIAKNGMYCTIDLKGTLGIGGVDSSGDWNNMNYIIGVPNVADGDWHTILFTWDGTTNANSIKMYKDNLIQPVAQVTPKREDKDPTEKLAFGKKVAPNTPYFNGDLDEIEIYNDVVEYGVKSTGISLDKTSTNLTVGQTDSLTATITPDNATNKNMKWVSSDPNIVTVDENGKVTAVKEGTTTVSAITMDGSNLNASCIVTVKKVDTPEPPTNNNGNAILTLTMTNGNIKLYTVSMTKVNDFISWYNNRASGSSGNAYYSFDKTDSLQPFTKKTEYVVFDKISSFEVDEYSK